MRERRKPIPSPREFRCVWVKEPSDEVIIEAGARALRLHAERKAAEAAKAEDGQHAETQT